MAGDEGPDGCGHGAGEERLDAIPTEECVGFHHGAEGQIRNLAPVRDIDIGDHVAQAQEGLQEQMAFLSGGFQGGFLLSADEPVGSGQTVFQILHPPGDGSEIEHPGTDGFRVLRIPGGDKLRQVAVTGGGNGPVTAEKVEFNPVGAGKMGVHPVFVLTLLKTALSILFGEAGVEGHQIRRSPGSGGDPGEMVDAGDSGAQILASDIGDAFFGLQHGAEELLGSEDLVAAAEGPDGGKDFIERADAEGHGVGVIDDPGIRREVPDGFGDDNIHGDRAQGAHESAGTDGVAYGLPDADALRQVDVALHFPEGAGENGDHDKICAGEGFLQRIADLIGPAGDGVRVGADFLADDPVALRSFFVDIVEADGSADFRIRGQIGHEPPGPAAGAAADVGDLKVFYVRHLGYLLFEDRFWA